jgi:tubulin-specific chaperone A
MPPSQVQIATSVLQRLIKEEASYHKELEQQQTRISKLENSDGGENENKDFQLKQEVCPNHVHLDLYGFWILC